MALCLSNSYRYPILIFLQSLLFFITKSDEELQVEVMLSYECKSYWNALFICFISSRGFKPLKAIYIKYEPVFPVIEEKKSESSPYKSIKRDLLWIQTMLHFLFLPLNGVIYIMSKLYLEIDFEAVL